jgi:hypothetical protein
MSTVCMVIDTTLNMLKTIIAAYNDQQFVRRHH